MLSRWQLAAIAGGYRLVGAGVEDYLPLAARLFAPDGHVAAGGGDGIAVGVLAMTLEVAPGVAHVAGGAHERIGRGPGELIDLGVPVGGFEDGDLADERLRAVAEGDAVVGKPGGKAGSAAVEYIFCKARLEIVEQQLARLDGGVAQGIGRGGGARVGKGQLARESAGRSRESREEHVRGNTLEAASRDSVHDSSSSRTRKD